MEVLVLDSAEIVVTVLCKVIEHAGHEARGFLSGDDLLEADWDGDVLLGMINMHPPNGFDVIESWLERGKAMPAVLMSGRALEEDDFLEADRLGAKAIVMMPEAVKDAARIAEFACTGQPPSGLREGVLRWVARDLQA